MVLGSWFDCCFISPCEVLTMDALDRIGEAPKAQVITLEELIESAREIRGQMVEDEYGLKAEDER